MADRGVVIPTSRSDTMRSILSSQGRLNRGKYTFACLSTFVLLNVIGVVSEFYGIDEEFEMSALHILVLVATLLTFGIFIIQLVKRLHDVNRSGKDAWLLFIPGYNLFLLISLMFEKGAEGPNPYGLPTGKDNKPCHQTS